MANICNRQNQIHSILSWIARKINKILKKNIKCCAGVLFTKNLTNHGHFTRTSTEKRKPFLSYTDSNQQGLTFSCRLRVKFCRKEALETIFFKYFRSYMVYQYKYCSRVSSSYALRQFEVQGIKVPPLVEILFPITFSTGNLSTFFPIFHSLLPRYFLSLPYSLHRHGLVDNFVLKRKTSNSGRVVCMCCK